MARDFFDDDLRDHKLPDAAGNPDDGSTAVPDEISQARMARQRTEITSQVAGTTSEIERLRMRQQELEQEKSNLETLSHRQSEYERAKREIADKLGRSVTLLGKESSKAARMQELFAETRDRFDEMLNEIRAINESDWPDEGFEHELAQALALVEASTGDYGKAMARIEAMNWYRDTPDRKLRGLAGDADDEGGHLPGFGYWLKAGFALVIPFAILFCLLLAAYLFYMGAL